MSCSLCMIVRNEEESLGRCLQSVIGLFDEIIIVDTGSEDDTIEIALQFVPKDKLFSFFWQDDFSAARNFAFSKATCDYAMWLDADDVILESSRDELRKTLSELGDTNPDMVFMPYNVAFDEDGRPTVSFERERIIRMGCGYRFEGAVHEAVPPCGKLLHSKAAVTHLGKSRREPGRNLRILRKIASERELTARECYYFARELSWSGDKASAEIFYKKCIEDDSAWSENRISSCIELSEIYHLAGKSELAADYLLKSLEFGLPRADMCCMLGNMFLDKNQPDTAAFWYLLAANSPKPEFSFVPTDYFGYIPYIQLAVVFDRKKDPKKAGEYNELAGKFKPNGKEFLYNREYFNRQH